jgi:hypothetical protein
MRGRASRILVLLSIFCALLLPTLADQFDVYFETSKPLGMKLSSDLSVQGFVRNGGTKLPAEASGWLRVGDKIVAVNGESTVGKDINTVVRMIGSASLPKKLTFVTSGGSNRTKEMANHYDGPKGIHGHEGVLELAKDGNPLGSIPFLQAMFGGLTNCKPAPIVVVNPSHGCGAYRGLEAAFDAFAIVDRGVCAFSDKAIIAQQASAMGLIVVNDQPSELIRMPIDPSESQDIALPVVMVEMSDGATVKQLVEKAGGRRAIMGRLVRKGQPCKPWRKATVVGEADANGKAPTQNGLGDPAAPSGELLLFPPGFSLSAATAAAAAAPEAGAGPSSSASPASTSSSSRKSRRGVRGGSSSNNGEGEGDGEGEGEEDVSSHVHSAGFYSDKDGARGDDGLMHEDGNGVPRDDAERALSGGSRARRMLEARSRRNRAEAGDGDGEADAEDEELTAVDVQPDGEQGEEGEKSKETPSPAAEAAARIAGMRARASGRFEYLLSKSGHPVPQGQLKVVAAEPPDGCSPITNPGGAGGGALLVDRGGCSFTVKAKYAAAAGAALLVVANTNAGLFPVTVAGPEEGGPPANSALPVMMVTKIAGRAIRAALTDARDAEVKAAVDAADAKNAASAAQKASAKAGQQQNKQQQPQQQNKQQPQPAHAHHHGESAEAHAADFSVTVSAVGDPRFSSIWEELTALMDVGAWPAEAPARRKLYLRLSRIHHPDRSSGSADRFELLAYLYKRANFRYDPSSEPDFVDDYQAPHAGA